MSERLSKTVLEAFDKEDPNIVRAACAMAGELGLASAERGLINALAHKSWQVQAEAAKALGRLGAVGAVPYLKRILKVSNNDLRQKVLAYAGLKGDAPAADSSDRLAPRLMRQAAVALSALDPKIAQEALLEALGTDNVQILSAAMAGLANLGSIEGRERMVELLGHEDPVVRRTAAASLGKLRDRGAVRGLLGLLQDSNPGVRKEGLIALNHIKDPEAIGPIMGMTTDADAGVRRVAAIALGNTRRKKPELVEALVRGLRDQEAEVRRACLSALGNLRVADALEAVAELLGDTSSKVAAQAGAVVTVLAQCREAPDYDAA